MPESLSTETEEIAATAIAFELTKLAESPYSPPARAQYVEQLAETYKTMYAAIREAQNAS